LWSPIWVTEMIKAWFSMALDLFKISHSNKRTPMDRWEFQLPISWKSCSFLRIENVIADLQSVYQMVYRSAEFSSPALKTLLSRYFISGVDVEQGVFCRWPPSFPLIWMWEFLTRLVLFPAHVAIHRFTDSPIHRFTEWQPHLTVTGEFLIELNGVLI
jgi:hypothetical protein